MSRDIVRRGNAETFFQTYILRCTVCNMQFTSMISRNCKCFSSTSLEEDLRISPLINEEKKVSFKNKEQPIVEEEEEAASIEVIKIDPVDEITKKITRMGIVPVKMTIRVKSGTSEDTDDFIVTKFKGGNLMSRLLTASLIKMDKKISNIENMIDVKILFETGLTHEESSTVVSRITEIIEKHNDKMERENKDRHLSCADIVKENCEIELAYNKIGKMNKPKFFGKLEEAVSK